jgi:hypothetical protein
MNGAGSGKGSEYLERKDLPVPVDVYEDLMDSSGARIEVGTTPWFDLCENM